MHELQPGRGAIADAEAADVGDRVVLAGRSGLAWSPPGLDQAVALQPGEHRIQRAALDRPEAGPLELGGQGVAVLFAVDQHGQRRQLQHTTQPLTSIVHRLDRTAT